MTQPRLSTLPNGVRVLVTPMPQMLSTAVGVFVHTGSRNELEDTNGLSHFLEHMAFKGTRTRDVKAIYLDAEQLGADINAYTSRETTAYYITGLSQHAPELLRVLADIVCHSTFPEHEIDREREVILQEATEYEEDPSAVSLELLARASYGTQPMAMPIIGPRSNIERFTRADLLAYVASQYSGPNIIVAVAGNVDPDAIEILAAKLFSTIPSGSVNEICTPTHLGGIEVKRLSRVSQVFVNVAFPVPSITQGHHPAALAAVLFGGGMSSPLMECIRERMGLAYSVSSGPDFGDNYGQFIIDAVTTPNQLDAFLTATAQLLREHAEHIDPVHLERAKNQLCVALATSVEHPFQTLERGVQGLFTQGGIIDPAITMQRIRATTAEDVRSLFETMLQARPAMSLAGKGARKSAFETLTAALR